MSSFVDRLFTPPRDHDPLGVHRRRPDVSGNGADLGQVVAMLKDLIVAQQQMRAEMTAEFQAIERRLGNLERRVGSLDERVGSLDQRVGSLDQQVASLREEVRSYHGSVVGHGVLISELEGRVSRIENHLSLPPAA